MSVTTEEAERLSLRLLSDITNPLNDECAAALRSLAAERDALQAEKVNLRDDLASVERERAHQHGRADRNAAEYAREQKKREQLQAENARLREAIEMARECIDDKDVIGARQTLTMALGETQ